MRHIIQFLLCTALFVANIEAACKTDDAEWKHGSRGPSVTQPSRTDPSKVMISWGDILKDGECADKFTVLLWKTGETKERARRIEAPDKRSRSMMIDIDPCLEYHFEVELVENDWTHTDTKNSKPTTFSTQASPEILDQDRQLFTVNYHYDHTRRISDVSKASISFPKSMLKNPNCINRIEISGTELPRHEPRPSSSSQNQFVATSRHSHHGHGGGGYHQSIGGHGYYSGGHHGNGHGGDRPSYGNNRPTSSPWHTTSSTYRPYYYENNFRKKRELMPGSKAHDRRQPSSGNIARESGGYGGSGGWGSGSTGGHGGSGGIHGSVQGQVQPPFINDIIEITADIKPCYPYKFTLKIFSPLGTVLTEVRDLVLPQLSDNAKFKPPELARLFNVDDSNPNNPRISVQSGLGIPESCIKDFFYAVDAHIKLLERSIDYHVMEQQRSRLYGDMVTKKLHEQKMDELGQFGCVCKATLLTVNTTDADHFNRFREAFGIYIYKGMQNGKPFYERKHNSSMHVPHHQRGHVGGLHHTSHGVGALMESLGITNTRGQVQQPVPIVGPHGVPPTRSPNAMTTTSTTASPKSNRDKPYYLYWDFEERAWTIGDNLEGRDPLFQTNKNSQAKCPADPANEKKWEYSGTLSWRSAEDIYVSCSEV